MVSYVKFDFLVNMSYEIWMLIYGILGLIVLFLEFEFIVD